MDQREIYFGDIKAHFEKPEIKGEPVLLQNESFYKISNSDIMRPFFMSIVSDSDHWMFISSNRMRLLAARPYSKSIKMASLYFGSLFLSVTKGYMQLPEIYIKTVLATK